MSLASAGEHKTAVDALSDLNKRGGSCSPGAVKAVGVSRRKLGLADSFVRRAMDQKKSGDLVNARSSLEEALEIYPRYYWVKKLLRGVEKSIIIETESLLSEAHYLESVDDPAAARLRLQSAILLYPDDVELKAELARLDKIIEGGQNTPGIAKAGTGAARQPAEIASAELKAAHQAGKEDRLDDSVYHLSQALILVPSTGPVHSEAVEYARVLGLKFYSTGRFTQAREIWKLALGADPSNAKLKKYLDEVQSRLEDLEHIKRRDNGKKTR